VNFRRYDDGFSHRNVRTWVVVAWRETASQLAQDDIDALCRVAVPRAQREIEATGWFFPFAFAIDPRGEVVSITVDRPMTAFMGPMTTLDVVHGPMNEFGRLRRGPILRHGW
jgi:hypothetical protein